MSWDPYCISYRSLTHCWLVIHYWARNFKLLLFIYQALNSFLKGIITFSFFSDKNWILPCKIRFSWNASYRTRFRGNWVKYYYDLWEAIQVYNQLAPWAPQAWQSMKFSWNLRAFWICIVVHCDKLLLKEELFSEFWSGEDTPKQLFTAPVVLIEV